MKKVGILREMLICVEIPPPPPTSIPALIAMKKWQIGGADVNKVMDFN